MIITYLCYQDTGIETLRKYLNTDYEHVMPYCFWQHHSYDNQIFYRKDSNLFLDMSESVNTFLIGYEHCELHNGFTSARFLHDSGKTVAIGVISINEQHRGLVKQDWSEIARKVNHNAVVFGNFCISNAFLEKVSKDEELAQSFRHSKVCYTNLPDCVISGKSRTTGMVAGDNVHIYSIFDSETLEDVMALTHSQIEERYSESHTFGLYCNIHFQ